MSESYAEFQEADGSVRMAGQLAYPQATPSDVLTVQDDGTIAAETGGGGITPPVDIVGTDPDTTPLTIDGPPDQVAPMFLVQMPTDVAENFPNAVQVKDSDGNNVFSVDGYGDFELRLDETGGGLFEVKSSSLGTIVRVTSDHKIGFFSQSPTPVVQPVVPATPLPQDIVDALVALGLVSQSA